MSNVIKETAVENVRETVEKVVERLGGMELFAREGERVLLKPNFNTADAHPGSSAPDFIAAACDVFHEAGAEVVLAESSTFSKNTGAVMRAWGIDALTADRPWLTVIDLNGQEWTKKPVPGGTALKHVSVPTLLDEVDRLVLLPCLKTHFLARYTGALKLSVAFMKPSERYALHARKLQEKIGELNALIRPDLVLMDARKCFITKGPSHGEVRGPGLVLGSTSRIAVDIEGIRIIQGYEGNTLADIAAEDLTQIAVAAAMGVDAGA